MVDLVDHAGRSIARLSALNDTVIVHIAGDSHTADTIRTIDDCLEHLDLSRLRPVVRERPWATRRAHAVLLLFLASRWLEITQAGMRAYHLTLSYALPLALDRAWRVWAEENADSLVATGQLVAVPTSDLVAVAPDRNAAVRHRRLIRAHRDTTVGEHGDLDAFLGDWTRFSANRYGRTVPDDELTTLAAILSMSGCRVRDLIRVDTLIGRSVICWHQSSNATFDLMATWQAEAARLRPGIYSGVNNLLDAHDRRARYSLCYGQFPYKDDIVGDARRLTLLDLCRPAPG